MDILIGIAAATVVLSGVAITAVIVWGRLVKEADVRKQLAIGFSLIALAILALLEMGLLETLRDGAVRAKDGPIQPFYALFVLVFGFLAGAAWAEHTLRRRRNLTPPSDTASRSSS